MFSSLTPPTMPVLWRVKVVMCGKFLPIYDKCPYKENKFSHQVNIAYDTLYPKLLRCIKTISLNTNFNKILTNKIWICCTETWSQNTPPTVHQQKPQNS